ncbi:SusC/RagA family TonB-linked outer membrane protein [Roseisolibacter sp. H3M3-2]|uniref:SusC/RagA family TonB-linked outer membrane protein n=1 Tax=Roseisolibacter sp. H3M3-2 TaxID=3031323 RepID=UPI0023DB019D|nr:SusC/RagA family TonB-linked outer membrane protein [Roseisolibacter sp. H3M3-2]MDF1501303.1 SusC/RagA family TonB-linked outer membrane protein [Roseisolibacter sp. H3M3-2]
MSLKLVRAAGLCLVPMVLGALVPRLVLAQGTGTVRGRVTDAAGQRPIADAQVSVSGTTVGAITNAAGDYVIANVPAGAQQLRVRRIGFQAASQAVTVNAGASVTANFSLSQAAAQLDQVVVTGTGGATTRRTVGNAITTINAAEITRDNSISNVSEILQSKTPGVTILPGSGTPGTAGDIRIRGSNSLSGSRPVIFIDGIRMSNEGLGNFNPTGTGATGQAFSAQITSGLDFLNPEDIESIEVIKGPAAATLYGADASSGVIQILTKRGIRGQQKPQWTLRGERGLNQWGTETLTNYLTCDSARIAGRTTVNGVSEPNFPGCQGRAVGTVITQNPLDIDPAALRDGTIQRLNVGLRGGADRYSYFLSGDKDDEYGVYFNSFNRRKAGRGNFTLVPNDRTELAINVSYAQNDLRLPPQDESVLGVLLNAVRSQPGARPTGNFRTVFTGTDTIVYPNQSPERANNYNNRTRSDRLQLGATLNYNPASWLRNRLTVGTDQIFSTADVLVLPGDEFEPVGNVLQRTPRFRDYTVDYVGQLPYKITPSWSGTTSFGTQIIARLRETLTATGAGLGAPDVTVIGSAQTTTGTNTYSENNSVGYFGQQEVSWRNRLFLTGAVRADDNSSFGTNFDLIVYPKFSLSWVLSEEPALEGVFKTLATNSFKLRSAWGQAGRAPDPYTATRTYQIIRSTLSQTSTGSGLITNSYGNQELKPERGEEFEVGFESSHLGDRLGLDFTYYNRRTRDMLVGVPVPPSVGFISSPITNLGTVKNSGLELALTATPVSTSRFVWDTRINGSTNNDILETFGVPGKTSEVPISQAYGAVQQHRVGYRLGSYWAPVIQRDASGNIRLTAGGAIDTVGTTQYIGPSAPTRELGFSNTFTFFRNFRLYALLDYKGGHYLFNLKERNRCQTANDNCARANDPRFLGARNPRNAADSLLRRELDAIRTIPSLFIEKADFVKLREVSLSVTIPQRLIARSGAETAQLVLSGRNLGLWTDYTGLDPEVNSYGGRNFNRVDAYAAPMARRLSAQLNFTF